MLVKSGTIYVGKLGNLCIVAYQPFSAEGVSVAYCCFDGAVLGTLKRGIIQRHGIAFNKDGGGSHNHWTEIDHYSWKVVGRNANISYVQSLTDDDIFHIMSMAGGEA